MAIIVTSDQSWRVMPKESVKYPVIPKQKEYYIVHQGLSVNTTAFTGTLKTGTPFFLPDKGTIVAVHFSIDHNGEVGNELYGLSRSNIKLNDDTIATLCVATRHDSTVGQACYDDKERYMGGLWIPVNDDDDVSVQITCDHANQSGIVYCGSTVHWYLIKED